MLVSERRQQRKGSGFTLTELLIVLAIIGLLLAVALPSYRKQAMKSNRASAKAVLMQLISREEAFFSDRKVYATTLAGLGYTQDPMYVGTDGAITATSTGALYTVSFVAGATQTAFTLQAAPTGTQASDTCGTLSITSLGVKSPTTSGCW